MIVVLPVARVQDEGETIVDLRDEFIGLRSDIAKVSRQVPSDRFHASQIPAKAKGLGSVRVMAKTRLTGLRALRAFVFFRGIHRQGRLLWIGMDSLLHAWHAVVVRSIQYNQSANLPVRWGSDTCLMISINNR
jgi:hypothetical protein